MMHIGSLWELHAASLPPLQVKLVHVATAPPMNKNYVCYGAEFQVMNGIRPPCMTYKARFQDREWDLLFTPIGPDDDGEELVQAIIHTRIS